MPATLVVDASVIGDFLIVGGPFQDAADRFVSALGWETPIALVAPDLIALEVASLIHRRALRKEISSREADESIARLSKLPITTVASSVVLEGAWALRKHTIYDASYAALAAELRLPLVTTDRRLAGACRSARIRAWLLDGPELSDLLDTLRPAAE